MTKEPKPLNHFEVWVSEHAGPVFVAVAAAIVLCAGAFFWVWEKSGDTQDQVNVLRPQVTKINQAVCDARSLESEAKARRCAERIRVGLVNCRRYDRCRAAFIAALTYPPPARPEATSTAEGGGAQNPSTAGQQPAPGQPGGGDKGGSHDGDNGHAPGTKPPKPSPAPAPAPETGTGSSAAPEQGNEGGGSGDQGDDESQPPSKGGVEVEACLLAVCAEVGVGR